MKQCETIATSLTYIEQWFNGSVMCVGQVKTLITGEYVQVTTTHLYTCTAQPGGGGGGEGLIYTPVYYLYNSIACTYSTLQY